MLIFAISQDTARLQTLHDEIAEAAPEAEIRDFLHEDDIVRVKVIGVNPQGKISMSVKQAADPQPEQQKPRRPREQQKPRIYEPKRSVPQSEMSFEDKLLHFKQMSEDKICDRKRGSERRGGSRSRRS